MQKKIILSVLSGCFLSSCGGPSERGEPIPTPGTGTTTPQRTTPTSIGTTGTTGTPTSTGMTGPTSIRAETTTRLPPPPPPPPEIVVDVKDQTPFPPLQNLAPGEANVTGWIKTLNTQFKNIPDVLPTPPGEKYPPSQIFNTAEKTINGINRIISVVFGDIRNESDAIVNAANRGLEGGGGIDGHIHVAALQQGPDGKVHDFMKQEAIEYKKLKNISSFPVGSAMVTHPYGLKDKITMVIFTVGPKGKSDAKKNQQLYSAIYNSLLKGSEYGAKSISIPAVSTGIFGFPLDVAADLFFKAALQFFADHPATSIENIRFLNFDKKTTVGVAKGFIRTFK